MELIIVAKPPLARGTVVLPVASSVHMLIPSFQTAKLICACITLPSVVAIIIHVVITIFLVVEPGSAIVALILLIPMVKGVHMLAACTVTSEGAIA